jgi:hypothetical protein
MPCPSEQNFNAVGQPFRVKPSASFMVENPLAQYPNLVAKSALLQKR